MNRGTPETSKLHTRMARVRRALRKGPKTIEEIMESTRLGPKPVKKVLEQLEQENAITHSGEGVKGDPLVYRLVTSSGGGQA